MNRSVLPAKELTGTLVPPADKSVSHRAAILNSLAAGEVVIDNFSGGRRLRLHPPVPPPSGCVRREDGPWMIARPKRPS